MSRVSSANDAQSSAAAPTWRQFAFYNVEAVKDARDLAVTPETFKSPNEISCTAAGQGTVLVADIHGGITQLTPAFEASRSWLAHEDGRVTHLRFAGTKGLVVSLGEENASTHPVLKVWDLRHIDKKTGDPRCLASQPISTGTSPYPASMLAITATLSYVAIGLADGAVLLLRHLDQAITSARDSTQLAAAVKPKQIHTSVDPITGLGFRAGPDKSKQAVTLFIVTTAKVLSYPCHGRSAQAAVIDDVGAGLHCSTMTNEGQLVIAREEAIYTFGPEGREACVAYEGLKSSITAAGSSLVIVTPPFLPSLASNSATVRSRAAASSISTRTDISRVGIFDLALNVVTHSGTVDEGIREVFCEFGDVFVLSNSGTLLRLSEKSTPAKLELLYGRGLYLLAVSLARTAGCDDDEVADIKKRYGDHLYVKGDYDGAMAQFLQTVGYVQPSYVIRKFLDAQRIHNLLSYLEELHNRKLANSAHTGLLLNCIAKLGDTERLDTFVREAGSEVKTEDGEAPFDLDTAIRVMRQAGFYEHALALARRFDVHESVLAIQLEDRGEWHDALRYVRKLGAEAAEDNVRRQGHTLLQHAPKDATTLMIDLCCGTLDRSDALEVDAGVATPAPSRAPYLSYLSYGGSKGQPPAAPATTAPSTVRASSIRSGIAPDSPSPSTILQNRRSGLQASGSYGPEPTPAAPPPPTRLPSPRTFFANFIDNPDDFVRFLETVAEWRYGQRLDPTGPSTAGPLPAAEAVEDEDPETEQRAIWNTLLELYLAQGHQTKALKLLQSPATRIPYDPTQALVVCTAAGFTEGVVHLYERLGLEEDIVRLWIDRDDGERAVEALRKYGEGRPGLYKLVLRYLTAEPARLDKYSAHVTEILEVVERERILHPIEVTQILGRTNAASIGLIRDYLKRRIASEKEEIDSDRALISSYRTETAKKQREIAELTDPNTPRVFQVTRCSSCGGQLDLPAIHFMCRHSYHQRCLGESESECPNCAKAHGLVREIVRSNLQFADRHDLFLTDVEESEDGWAIIAGAYAKGLLAVAQPEPVPSQ